jgi:hypothetical protein
MQFCEYLIIWTFQELIYFCLDFRQSFMLHISYILNNVFQNFSLIPDTAGRPFCSSMYSIWSFTD